MGIVDVDRRSRKALVEFPTEADSGANRAWVRFDDLAQRVWAGGCRMILSDREITGALDLEHIHIEPRPQDRSLTSTAIDFDARLGVGVHVTAPRIHAGFGYNKAKDKPGLPIQLEIF